MRSSASRALSAKVEATLARFDTAVKESSTRSIQSAREKQAQREDLQELADRITAEAEEDTPPGMFCCVCISGNINPRSSSKLIVPEDGHKGTLPTS